MKNKETIIELSEEELRKRKYTSYCLSEKGDEFKKCLIAEIYDHKLEDLKPNEVILIKTSIGALQITSETNYFIPFSAAGLKDNSTQGIKSVFSRIRARNRGKLATEFVEETFKLAQAYQKELDVFKDPPTFSDLLKNFSKATMKWAKAGFPTVPKAQFKKRLSVCRGCEMWEEKARFGWGKCNHKSCGCTKNKLWLTTESCPLDKWK